MASREHPSDAALITACRAGAQERAEAFRAIVARYQSLVCAVCYAAAGDRGLAEDLAQDTFLIAWRSLDELHEPSRLCAWLAGIARNVCRNARRRMRELPAGRPEPEGRAASPGDQLIGLEVGQTVQRALLRIPLHYREAIVLFYWEGRSSSQVAARLGLSEAAVQQRLSRARRHLRTELADQLDRDADRRLPAAAFTAAVVAAIAASASDADARGAGRKRLIGSTAAWLVGGAVTFCVLLAVLSRIGQAPEASRAVAGKSIEHGLHALPSRPTPPSSAAGGADDPPEPPGYFRVTGYVVDSDNVPVGGATVWINTLPMRTALSGPDGGFRFGALPDQTYELAAHSQDQVSRRLLYRPAVMREPIWVRLTPAGSLDLAVINTATRAPIAGASVELLWFGTYSTTTDDAGHAVLHGVGAAYYTATITAPDPHTGVLQRELHVTASPGETEHMTLELPSGAPIRGQLMRHGAPIAGETILAEALHAGSGELAHATTDRDGRWELPALPAGTYRIGTQSRISNAITVPHDGVTAVDGIALEAAGAALTGRVITATGAPVAYATIDVAQQATPWLVPTATWTFSSTPHHGVRRELIADRDGAFTASDLGAGSIVLCAHSGDASSRELQLDAVTDPVTLILDHATAIDGTVVTAAGAPVPGAQVSAFGDTQLPNAMDDPHATIADHEGRFHIGGLGTGRYRLRAEPWDAEEAALIMQDGLTVDAGGPPVRLVLPDAGTITGTVRFADGAASTGAIVRAGSLRSDKIAGPEGKFTLRGVPPGRYPLWVSGPGLLDTYHRDPVEVRAGASTDAGSLTVERGATLRGRVTAHGVAVAGAVVVASEQLLSSGARLTPSEPLSGGSAVTADDGSFAIPGVADGGYLIAERADLGRSRLTRVAHDDGARTYELVLEATGAVEGHIRRGAAGVEGTIGVAAIAGDTPAEIHFESASDPDGYYRISGLAPGAYQLSALTSTSRVQITAGATLTHDVQLPVGSDAWINVQWTLPVEGVRVVMIRGERTMNSYAELKAIVDRLEVRDRYIRFAGGAAITQGVVTDRVRIPDVDDGHYLVCIHPQLQSESPTRPIACRPLDVRAGGPAAELALTLPAHQP